MGILYVYGTDNIVFEEAHNVGFLYYKRITKS